MLDHGEKISRRPTIDIHAGGARSAVPAPRERDCAIRGAAMAVNFRITGCITAISILTARRCPSRWATSRRYVIFCSIMTERFCVFLILSGQYRGPIDFNSEILEQSKSAMTRLRNAKSNLKHLIETGSRQHDRCRKGKAGGL